MSSNYLTDDELLDFYTSKFKQSDLHSVEVTGFDEVIDVRLSTSRKFKSISLKIQFLEGK